MATGRYGQGRPRIWSGSLGRPGRAIDDRNHYSPWARDPSVASFYRLLCFPSWELSFYFSPSSYATVGYGDVTLPSRWRLLGPLESMAGVLMCGVSVCLLFATITRLLDRDPRRSRELGTANDPVAPEGESLY